MRSLLPILPMLLVFSSLWSQAKAFDGIGVLGDSTSTGAGSHPALEFDSRVLWEIFLGSKKNLLTPDLYPEQFRKFLVEAEPPTRVPLSVRENDGGSGWIWHNLMQAVSARTIEEHRLSYGYFLGRALGIRSSDILLAGENGARSSRAWWHAARLVGARQRDLPSRVVIFYTGNDLCAQTYDDVTSAAEYGDGVLTAMKYLVLNGHASPRGTTIYIPAFLSVTSLLHEKSILDRKINLHGEEVTCREARDRLFAPKRAAVESSGDPRFQIFSAFVPPSPVLLCPTLFSKAADDSSRQSSLANRIRAYRDAQKNAVREFNEWRGAKHPAKAFEAVYQDGTERIRFEGQDVAGDCFHLSANGQAKVASAMLKDMH